MSGLGARQQEQIVVTCPLPSPLLPCPVLLVLVFIVDAFCPYDSFPILIMCWCQYFLCWFSWLINPFTLNKHHYFSCKYKFFNDNPLQWWLQFCSMLIPMLTLPKWSLCYVFSPSNPSFQISHMHFYWSPCDLNTELFLSESTGVRPSSLIV